MLLLIQGAELLLEGKLNVFRDKDREFLLGFRYGKYPWSVFFDMVKEYELKLTEAFEKTVLPPKTDSAKVNKLYTELMMEHLNI
ncbi:hypothetical protein D3C87_2099890 [compost metagenome]